MKAFLILGALALVQGATLNGYDRYASMTRYTGATRQRTHIPSGYMSSATKLSRYWGRHSKYGEQHANFPVFNDRLSRTCSTLCNKASLSQVSSRYRSGCTIRQQFSSVESSKRISDCWMYNSAGPMYTWQRKHNIMLNVRAQMSQSGASLWSVKGQTAQNTQTRSYPLSGYNWMTHYCAYGVEHMLQAKVACGSGMYPSTTYASFRLHYSSYSANCMYKTYMYYHRYTSSTYKNYRANCFRQAASCVYHSGLAHVYQITCANTKAAWFINEFGEGYARVAQMARETAGIKKSIEQTEQDIGKETAAIAKTDVRIKAVVKELVECQERPSVGPEFLGEMKYAFDAIAMTVRVGVPAYWKNTVTSIRNLSVKKPQTIKVISEVIQDFRVGDEVLLDGDHACVTRADKTGINLDYKDGQVSDERITRGHDDWKRMQIVEDSDRKKNC